MRLSIAMQQFSKKVDITRTVKTLTKCLFIRQRHSNIKTHRYFMHWLQLICYLQFRFLTWTVSGLYNQPIKYFVTTRLTFIG